MLPTIQRILYATDLTEDAPYVFRYALSIARKHGSSITILHVQEPLSPFAQSLVELHIAHQHSEEMHAEAREKIRTTIEQRLAELCDVENCLSSDGENLVTDIQVLEGQPAETILTAAHRADADLIVMGSHRHSVLGEALLGSTANKVLHRSLIPILLVRPPEGA